MISIRGLPRHEYAVTHLFQFCRHFPQKIELKRSCVVVVVDYFVILNLMGATIPRLSFFLEGLHIVDVTSNKTQRYSLHRKLHFYLFTIPLFLTCQDIVFVVCYIYVCCLYICREYILAVLFPCLYMHILLWTVST